jgi:hypothetical protein
MVITCWHNQPHEGLSRPWGEGQDLSPNEMYAACVGINGIQFVYVNDRGHQCAIALEDTAGYATTLERLRDFTVRKIVYVGMCADVLDAREIVMAETSE